MAEDFQRMVHRPLILFAALDRESAQVARQDVHNGVPEQLRLAHEEDDARQGKLHREDVKVGHVICGDDDRPPFGKFSSPLTSYFMIGKNSARARTTSAAALGGISKVEFLFVTRIRYRRGGKR